MPDFTVYLSLLARSKSFIAHALSQHQLKISTNYFNFHTLDRGFIYVLDCGYTMLHKA